MLDIYAGSFTRYYTKNWKTKAQQATEVNGGVYLQINPRQMEASEEEEVDPAELEEYVEQWMGILLPSLSKDLEIELKPWSDTNESPYHTNQLTWEAYNALVLWAAFADYPDKATKQPDLSNLSNNPAYAHVHEMQTPSKFNSLTKGVELWMPCAVGAIFGAETPNGTTVLMSSIDILQSDLHELNGATWKADQKQIESWLADGTPDYEAPFEILAQFAFAVLFEGAKFCEKNYLPLMLDY